MVGCRRGSDRPTAHSDQTRRNMGVLSVSRTSDRRSGSGRCQAYRMRVFDPLDLDMKRQRDPHSFALPDVRRAPCPPSLFNDLAVFERIFLTRSRPCDRVARGKTGTVSDDACTPLGRLRFNPGGIRRVRSLLIGPTEAAQELCRRVVQDRQASSARN